MPLRLALFGGSFNPPGLHHRRLAALLAERFDQVIVVPCGPRGDKAATNALPTVSRAAMADMAFAGIPGVQVDLFDLEKDHFTRNWQLDERYSSHGEVWHVVGTDLIKGGATGQSEIQRTWERGTELWSKARFAVLHRPGHPFAKADLPPRAELIEVNIEGASRDIRAALEHGHDVSAQVTAPVLAYIQRYGLYRSPMPSPWARGSLADQRHWIYADGRNAKALSWVPQFSKGSAELTEAQFITAVGGDGTMLRAIREHWRARLPFFGVNAGHLGFLMNSAESVLNAPYPPRDVIFRQLPMLYLEIESEDRVITTTHGFNDAWVERASSQSAWLEVQVNGVKRLPKLVCDGALVSTAAGSTAYARSMGASPLLADTPAWLLVGSNVSQPIDWRSALLSIDATVEITTLDPARRPIRAYVDGEDQGNVRSMKARISRAAAVELVFDADHDMAEKIAEIQFRHASPLRGEGVSPEA